VKVFNTRNRATNELFFHEAHIMARLRDAVLDTLAAKAQQGDESTLGTTFGGHYVVEFYGCVFPTMRSCCRMCWVN